MKNLTPFEREMRRIARYEKKLAKQGYFGRIPYKPETLEEAKAMTAARIRSYYQTYDPITDEYINVNESRRRERAARAEHPDTQEDIPDESIIEAILERIRALPSYRWTHTGQVMLDGKKDALEGMLYDQLAQAEANDSYADYLNYLYSVQEQLIDALEPVITSSDQEEILQCFSTAAELMLGHAMSASEAIDIEENVNQYYDYMGE